MRNKRGGGGGHGMGQPNEGCAGSGPTPSLYLVTMATARLLAGLAVQRPWLGLIRVFRRGLSLGLIGRFTSPLIGRALTVQSSEGKKSRSTRVAGFKMAPASLGDVEGRPWVRPSLFEKRGAELGLALRVDGAAVGQ